MGEKPISFTFHNETTPENVPRCDYVPSNLHFIDYLRNVYIITCSVNAVFSPCAVFGNGIVLYSILQARHLHDPAHLLLAILTLTDLTVGLIQQPLYVIYKAAEINQLPSVSCMAGLLTNMFAGLFAGMSFLITTFITLDRFLALHLHLRYKNIVTKSLVNKVIVFFFLLFTVIVSFYPIQPRIPLFFAMTTIPLFLFISCLLYIKIYRIVRKHQRAISSQIGPTGCQSNVQNSLNVKKFWRFVVNFSYVYVIMVICFLPYAVTLLARGLIGITKEYKLSLNVTSTVIFINSSINPMVYCWKITEIKRAVFKTLRKMTVIQFSAALDQNSASFNPSKERTA